jgi:hypothetical protein
MAYGRAGGVHVPYNDDCKAHATWRSCGAGDAEELHVAAPRTEMVIRHVK